MSDSPSSGGSTGAVGEREEPPLWRRSHVFVLALGLVIFALAATVVFGPAGFFAADEAPDPPEGEAVGGDGGEPPEEVDETDDADASDDDPVTESDEGEEPPQEGDDTDDGSEATGDDIEGGDDADAADDADAGDEQFTYSTTIEVFDGDGEPVEGVPVQFNPVGAEEQEYTTDEDGEVTVAFDHPEPDETVEYVLAVGEGERIVEVERGEQIEEVPLSESTAALYDDGTDSPEETDDESDTVGP